jgi:hypothetical protein
MQKSNKILEWLSDVFGDIAASCGSVDRKFRKRFRKGYLRRSCGKGLRNVKTTDPQKVSSINLPAEGLALIYFECSRCGEKER